MNTRRLRPLVAAAAMMMCGCGRSPLTAARIEGAIAPTFANLVHVQLARLQLPVIAAADITVRASCSKVAAESGTAGVGDWICTLVWYGPNGNTLRDTYDLSVGADGCYVATIDGPETDLGGPTITASDGSAMRNLLHTFEGCFDTT